MINLCECGCGQRTNIAKRAYGKSRQLKGEPYRFLNGHALRAANSKKGSENHHWQGGRMRTYSGYPMLYNPTHPRARNNRYVLEHIVLAERALGHALPLQAQIHHVNLDEADNSRGNLVICENQMYHRLLHKRALALRTTGNVNSRKCKFCQRWDLEVTYSGSYYHKACHVVYDRLRRST